jgi:transposase
VIHVGIDLHKLESQICVINEMGEALAETRVPTRRDTLARALAAWPGGQVLVESCNESEWVARHLERCGHTVVVADPNFTPMYGHRHKGYKTDRRDARALASASAQGLYRRAHRTSEPRRVVRAELVTRDALVRTRSRYISVIRSRLRAEGWRVRSGGAESFVARVGELALEPEMLAQLQPLLQVMEVVNQKIAEADRVLEQKAKQEPVVRRLQSMPQVGPITALAFVAALDDVRRFRNAHQVESYLGLVPRERSSGEHQVRGRITKTGDKRVRWLLVECAWGIGRSQRANVEALQKWADKVGSRRGRTVAAVALARRLAGILYAMWRDDVPYDPKKLEHPRGLAALVRS